jgi:hypothetical protein
MKVLTELNVAVTDEKSCDVAEFKRNHPPPAERFLSNQSTTEK